MASSVGMHHWAATSGSMASPPKISVSAHASGETGAALPAAGDSVMLTTVGLRSAGRRSPAPGASTAPAQRSAPASAR